MFVGQDVHFVEVGRSGRLLYILLEVCPACKDKVEIKCMGSVGGKTPTEPKVCLFYSNLGHIEQDNILFITGVIRSEMSMNVAFKYFNRMFERSRVWC